MGLFSKEEGGVMFSEQQDTKPINQDDMTLPVPAIHFMVQSRPNGEVLTGFKNTSPAYVCCKVSVEMRVGIAPWCPLSELSQYPYNGQQNWNLSPNQEFRGNLSLPDKIRDMNGEKWSVGTVIDYLDGNWLKFEITEEQGVITGKRRIFHHPPRFFHWSSEAMCWIPEPCDTQG
jgi:hypothetical protein